jgi:hypothetical protein
VHRPSDAGETVRRVDPPVENHDQPTGGHLSLDQPLANGVEAPGEQLRIALIAGGTPRSAPGDRRPSPSRDARAAGRTSLGSNVLGPGIARPDAQQRNSWYQRGGDGD